MSSNEKNIPKRRFKEFIESEAWEERELGQIGKTQSGIGFPDVEQGGTDGIPFFKVSDMNNAGNEHEMVSANNYVSDEQLQRKKWKPIKTLPAVMFAKVGAAIMLNRKRLVRIPFLIDNNTMAYIFDNSWHANFGKTLFETINLPLYAQVGALPSYNSSDIESIKVKVPQKYEQEKIGEFFSNVENLITLHQRKLDKLKVLKKAYLAQMFPSVGESKPRLRFSGFNDDLEQRKFKEIFIIIQNNALSRAELNFEQGSAMNVHYGDILIKFRECLDVSKEEIPFITDDISLTKYKEAFLVNGDIIIADAAEDETVGKCSEIVGLTTETVISGLHTIPCRPTKVFASGYLGYYMNSNAYHNQLLPLIQGTKVSSISKTALKDTVLLYPKSIEEQALISQYFTKLNNLITLHQRKLEKLQNIKKAYLNEMFV